MTATLPKQNSSFMTTPSFAVMIAVIAIVVVGAIVLLVVALAKTCR